MRGCEFEGCSAKRLSRRHCSGHHWQLKQGRPLTPIARMSSTERFWSYVTKSPGCWGWSGPRNRDGYGKFSADSKRVSAHRFGYQLLVGSIPSGMEIDHSCRVRSCVNPAHLQIATRKQNVENIDVQRTSTTGVRGVGRSMGGKFRARVGHNGTTYYLVVFASIEEAGEAAKAKRLELHSNNLLDRKAS
jgi:hypothetical protein